jgi:hypothetical protein
MHGRRSGRVSIGFPEPRPNARNRRVYRLSRRLSVYGGHKSRRVRLRRREAITRRLLRVGGGLRAAARERDPQGRQRVFRDRARPRPDEVSAFIDAYRARFGVEPICRVLDVSASAYYHRATGARSARAAGDERLLALIEQVHVDNYDAYGYRKTWLALKRRGVRVGRVASSASCARRDSGGPSGAASHGGPRSRTRPRAGPRISSTATSPPIAPTSSGSPTSPTCAAGRGWCSSASSSTPSAAASWAGSSRRRCGPIWSSTRYGWR